MTRSNDMFKISVIIPCYQHASMVERCLDSLKTQTRRPEEVIVVDDGSTDGLVALLEPRVSSGEVIFFRQENMGGGLARNRGFDLSTGDLVLFADADLELHPTMLEELEQALLAHPDKAYAYCGFRFGWKTFRSFPFSAERLRRMNYIQTGALIRREAFPRFDESLKRFQDWDLWLTMLAQGREGVYVPQVLFRAHQKYGRRGISSWRPSGAYRLFVFLRWKPKWLQAYDAAREVILRKHHLPF